MFSPKHAVAASKIDESKTDKSQFSNFKYINNKHIIYICCVYEDGMGDLGHLVDLSKPEVLREVSQNLGFNIGGDKAALCHPLYRIGCQDSETVRRTVLVLLKENGILQEITPPEGATIDDYIKDHFESYWTKIKEKNPQVQITIFPKGQQDLWGSTLLREPMLDTTCGIFTISTKPLQAIDRYDRKLAKATPMRTDIREHGPWIKAPKNLNEYQEETGLSPRLFTGGIENRSLGQLGKDFRVILKPALALTLAQKVRVLVGMKSAKFKADLFSIQETKEEAPSEKAETVLKNTLFVPGYLQQEGINNAFIVAVARSTVAKKFLNLVFYVNGKLIRNLLTDRSEIKINFELLAKDGFSDIELHSPSGKKIIALPNPKGLRRLHLFYEYPLSNKDYESLYAIGAVFGGCSGDKSLELCLSNFLIPFAQVREYKKVFYQYMQDLIAAHYTENQNIIDYLALLQSLGDSKITPETINRLVELISSEGFVDDWRTIFENLHRHHNYYDTYPQVILKNLMYYELSAAIFKRDFSHAEEVLKYYSPDEIENIKEICTDKMYDYLGSRSRPKPSLPGPS